MLTVACVLYQGEDVPKHSKGIFTEEWVDRLYRGIKRNCTRSFRLVCFVDRDDYVFTEPVEVRKLELPYRNMFSLLEPFREDMGRVLFMGLDTIITGNIDHLADYRGPFAMLKDPWVDRPCSGVMMFPYTPKVWEAFKSAHHADKTMFGLPSDMVFLATVEHEVFDGPEWGVYSYKAHIKKNPALLDKASIVYFHGTEKPHELFAEEWVSRHWGEPLVAPAAFQNALNNDVTQMLRQAEENAKRPLPWLQAGEVKSVPAMIVGGGPSLAATLPDLVRMKQGGGILFALNNTHDWLIERGIVPDYHVMLDSRDKNAEFVRHPNRAVKYLISAFCHQSVFDALRGHDVTLWLNDMDGISRDDVILICGGSTVGLKTMCIAAVMGFKEMHLFGFDSSYSGGQHHAYPQPMNDTSAKTTVVVNGKTFLCDRWMAKQAAEFQPLVRLLEGGGCSVVVHGDGLIPWIAKAMEAPLTT